MSDGTIFIGAGAGGANPQALNLRRANRHGLIAGATGTGKTVTLQGVIEGFSFAGVPCFVADVKGDLSASPCPARRPRRCTRSSPRAPRRSAWPTGPTATRRCNSGTSTANRGTRYAPR
ncbi:helicase HerA-like domain-containing protein [Sphingomonas sp. MMS24-JH45]